MIFRWENLVRISWFGMSIYGIKLIPAQPVSATIFGQIIGPVSSDFLLYASGMVGSFIAPDVINYAKSFLRKDK
jgi:hypothetical protein